MLGPSANVYVEKAITWSGYQAQIFVHNQPLPTNSFIWGTEVRNPDHLGDITNYLLRLAAVLTSINVCEGVSEYEDFWMHAANSGKGPLESELYGGTNCFRSANCLLAVIDTSMCSECKKQKETFRKRQWKMDNAKGTNTANINNRYMQRKVLEDKAKTTQESNKKLKRKMKGLRQRIQKLVEKESIPVDHELGQDFAKILKENVYKMSDIQKLFWREQLKSLARQENPTSMRWHPMMIKVALHIQMISPAAHNYLRKSGFLALPSERRLFDFTHFVQAKEGIKEAILNLLKDKKDKLTLADHEKFFNLLLDEMTIRSDIVINKKGEVIGCVNLSKVEESIANLESDLNSSSSKPREEVSKKVLVYMIQGICQSVQEVVGIFATSELTAHQLYTRT